MSEHLTTEHTEEHGKAVTVPPSADDAEKDTNKAPSWLPESVQNIWSGISHKVKAARTGAIMATPAIIVNNSSNFLSASHVATEMLMFKSGMKGKNLIDDPSNPVNWVKQPAQKIFRDIFGIGKPASSKFTDIFRRNPIESFKSFINGNAASLREVEHQIETNAKLAASGKPVQKISLGNPWQTRTTGAGLIIFTLGATIPEKKESDQEIERMARMRTLSPLRYVFERYKQAVWFPEWGQHKREMLGLGFNIIGTLSMLGAWRNRGELNPAITEEAHLIAKGLTQGYKFNSGYFFTGLISFIQGMPLLFALDERNAYSAYGTATFVRTPTLFKSIGEKYKKKEEGRGYYMAGKLSFAIEDFFFLLIGGAQKVKNADGSYTIIDHEKLKKEAIKEAKEEKIKIKAEKSHHKGPAEEHAQDAKADTPSNTLAKVEHREAAMPERVAAHQVGQETQQALMAQ